MSVRGVREVRGRRDVRGVRHAIVAVVAGVALVPALSLARIVEPLNADAVGATFLAVLALASFAASGILVALGRALADERRAVRLDAISFALMLAVLARALVAPLSRDGAGLVLVLALAVRLAPLAWLAIVEPRTGARLAFAASLVAYLAIAWWGVIGMAAQGDQAHYLLAADALARGGVDLAREYADPSLYESLAEQPLADADRTTHAVAVGEGSRLLQGYGLPVVLLPGWIVAGRAGALAMVALVAAFASSQTQLLARHVAGDTRASRAAWALVAFTVPFLSFATSVFPNVVGAALLVVLARFAVGSGAAAAVAGLAAGLTLFLTPRDGTTALLLAIAALALGRGRPAFVAAGAATVAVGCAVALAIYGLPVPYAGYVLGAAQVERVAGAPLAAWRPDVALPGLLFDRAFGLAGTAPWVFVGALGVVPLLRQAGRRAVALLAVVLVTLGALALYGPWQGGWSPPNRYTAELLPLWAPFVAAGLAAARDLARRAIVVLAVAASAVATVWLAAIPRLAYSGNDSELARWLGRYAPVDPLLWLPSFAVDPLLVAEARSLALALGVAVLVVLGARRRSAP